MSFGTAHTFSQLTKNSVALPGQRLVRLIAKGKEKHPNLRESMCVSVPPMEQDAIVDKVDQFMPHIMAWIAGVQDKVIREYRIDSGAGEVPDSAISVDAILTYLVEDAASGGARLTTAMLIEWFNGEFSGQCREWLTQKPAMANAGDMLITQKLNAVRDTLVTFADVRAKHTKPVLNLVLDMGASCVDDPTMGIIAAKAQKELEELELVSGALDDLL